ncbi:Arm DNA-binding domain-containing protein [Pedobacter superstes]|uniref:Arm DNA-binding domain-containing protein n=1 Tax=Pedobacter superstes TaxID=3133441 RepID=UPI003D71D700
MAACISLLIRLVLFLNSARKKHVKNTATWATSLIKVISVKIILETRKPTTDGTFRVYFQICYDRKTRTRSSKIYVKQDHWNDEKKEIKKSHSESKLLNQKLRLR